jgi:hypothetical protein
MAAQPPACFGRSHQYSQLQQYYVSRADFLISIGLKLRFEKPRLEPAQSRWLRLKADGFGSKLLAQQIIISNFHPLLLHISCHSLYFLYSKLQNARYKISITIHCRRREKSQMADTVFSQAARGNSENKNQWKGGGGC